MKHAGLWLFGLGAGAAVLLARGASANAATRPPGGGGGAGTAPSSSSNEGGSSATTTMDITPQLQPRPLPADALELSRAERALVMRVAQTQLNALGYGPLAVDGVSGPATQRAVTAFLARPENQDLVAAYPGTIGDTAYVYAIDDAFRALRGVERANPSLS